MPIEHPQITEMNAKGTCAAYRNYYGVIDYKKHDNVEFIRDYFGDIFNIETDAYAETREGHYVTERNLIRYLEEVLGMEVNFVY